MPETSLKDAVNQLEQCYKDCSNGGSITEWFALENDLIGGWCVSSVNKPPSEFSHGEHEIADFTLKEHAEFIAAALNHLPMILDRLRMMDGTV